MRVSILALSVPLVIGSFDFEEGFQCSGMVDKSPYVLVDSYNKVSWKSAHQSMLDCGHWCKELFLSITDPVSHCCWYAKGTAISMGFEICSLSNAPIILEMDQRVLINQGADEMEGFGAWVMNPEQI